MSVQIFLIHKRVCFLKITKIHFQLTLSSIFKNKKIERKIKHLIKNINKKTKNISTFLFQITVIFDLKHFLINFLHFDNITRYFYISLFKEYNLKGG